MAYSKHLHLNQLCPFLVLPLLVQLYLAKDSFQDHLAVVNALLEKKKSSLSPTVKVTHFAPEVGWKLMQFRSEAEGRHFSRTHLHALLGLKALVENCGVFHCTLLLLSIEIRERRNCKKQMAGFCSFLNQILFFFWFVLL